MRTHLNPADDCSRGLMPGDPNWKRFHYGPDFLREPEENWPDNPQYEGEYPASVFAFEVVPLPEQAVPFTL